MPKRKEKKDLCTERLSFRCTKKEKTKFVNHAKKNGMNLTEAFEKASGYLYEVEKRETKKQINQATCACEVQRLVNYLRKKKQDDSYIQEVCDKLWDLVK